MANDTTTAEAVPVVRTGQTTGRANLRAPWPKGVSGNPKGRPSHRKLFEEALARAVTGNAEAIVEALVKRALEGDGRMMAALLDRLVPKITRHEIGGEGEGAPSRMVIEFARPEQGAA